MSKKPSRRGQSDAERRAMFYRLNAGEQGRTRRARTLDSRQTSKNVIDFSKTPEEKWKRKIDYHTRKPGRTDIIGVDTIGSDGVLSETEIDKIFSETATSEERLAIQSKTGIDIDLVIRGTQEDPKIVAGPFMAGGKKVSGNAVMQHWKHKGAEEGLYFRKQEVYVQCATAMKQIRKAISELPHKKYYAEKVEDVAYADGYNVLVQKWKFDRMLKTERGTIISDSTLGTFLDAKGITKIEIGDAIRMWADERESAYIEINESGNRRAKAMFEADVAEVGYRQACENAGIPKKFY